MGSDEAFRVVLGSGDAPLRHAFEHRLNELDDAFLAAAIVVVEAMPDLTARFLDGDLTAVEDARAMAADVSVRIRKLEDDGFILLARESPVGRDLRRLVALLRLATDIERSASLLKHVSESAAHLDPRALPEPVRQQISEMALKSADVFRAGIDAWRTRDGLAITDIDALDGQVDALQVSLLETASQHEDAMGASTLAIGLIARYLERIADHGVALAKDVAFVVTGERVTTQSN